MTDKPCDFSKMFRCVLFAVGLFALCLAAPARVDAQDSIAHTFCRMTWGSQPAQMGACVNAQIAGAQTVVRWLDWAKRSTDPAAMFILATFEECRARWSPDYQQISACLKAGSPLSPPETTE